MEQTKYFCWTVEFDQAFRRLREQLTMQPVLVFPENFYWIRIQSDGQERVVAYAS